MGGSPVQKLVESAQIYKKCPYVKGFIIVKIVGKLWTGTWMGQSISKIGQKMPIAYGWTPVDLKEPSPLVEAGIEQQACLGLYRFHEAGI